MDCKNEKSNGNAFILGKKQVEDVEKITKPRCFRCNSLRHLKASCPLYKIEKDKATAKALSIAKESTPIAEKVVGPSKSRFEFDEKTKKNIARHSAYCEYLDRLAAGEKGLVDPCLTEDDDTSNDSLQIQIQIWKSKSL